MQHGRPLRFYAQQHVPNASRILAIVEMSVRPSVTLLSPVKTMQARITKSLLQAATRNLTISFFVTKFRAPG